MSGFPAPYEETNPEEGAHPADWGWVSLSLKGTLSFMTHCGIPGKRWLWASPQGSTRKLRQQEQKEEAEVLLDPGDQLS